MLYALQMMENKLDQLLAGGGGGSGSAAALPIGSTGMFTNGAIPSGWQNLDGTALTIADNPAAYALLGHQFDRMLDEMSTRAAAMDMHPQMTADSMPSGYVASASSSAGAGYEAYRAFDSAYSPTTNGWMTAAGEFNGALTIALPAPMGISRYIIIPSGTSGTPPKDFTLEGSTDGTNWTVLDAQTGIVDWTAGSNEFGLNITKLAGMYSQFRLNVSAGVTADTALSIRQLLLMIAPPVLIGNPPPAGFFRVPNLVALNMSAGPVVMCMKIE